MPPFLPLSPAAAYSPSNQPFWASNTQFKGTGPWSAIMQDDGNFVVYDGGRHPTWASNTQQG